MTNLNQSVSNADAGGRNRAEADIKRLQAAIALSVGADNNSVIGRVISDDITASGADISLLYVDADGARDSRKVTADADGRFVDPFNRLVDQYEVSAQAHLLTPAGNRLVVNSKLIQPGVKVKNGFVTEDARRYLVTESGDYLNQDI